MTFSSDRSGWVWPVAPCAQARGATAPATHMHTTEIISGDGFIDVFDMVIVGMAYEAVPGDLNWDPTADINGDNVVDIVDLVLIGSNYEKGEPQPWVMF